jgi:hypothetical protein
MVHRLHFTNDTRSALATAIGRGILDAREPDLFGSATAWTGYLALVLSGGEILAFSVDSVSAESDDPREEYFRLAAEMRSTLPPIRRWPEGPMCPWRVAQRVAGVVGAKVETATVLTSATLRGGCDVGVRLAMSNGCTLDLLGEHSGPPQTLGVEMTHSKGGGHGV